MSTFLKRKRVEDISSGFKRLKINNLSYQTIELLPEIVEKYENRINNIEIQTNEINENVNLIKKQLNDINNLMNKISKLLENQKIKEDNSYSYIS